jgi:hypothetical protein
VWPLLEVGTDFHVEMPAAKTSLNGAILGMTKTDKLDEIIEFSGCEAIYRHTGKTLQQRNDGTLALPWRHFLEPILLLMKYWRWVMPNSKKTIGKMQDISAGEDERFCL